jgi:crossover junction endodeoxyribonuclease RuvC
MRWLGIDPGLRTTGFGVIEIEGQRLRYISSGIIESGSIDLGLPNRLVLYTVGCKRFY